ncbi:helix-turn-helix domain-containing protein [Pectobacterium aroidearum]|uniref:helix-turn-helix domain-containing protein n=1 Tax=Pectobacterium aroidearum TaxID=1201031 RepID=UPI002A7FF6D4|nr:helix-turn-helix domain-containing protein [Pectobacterium aroidearum]MDY4385045.1 helix-turn-helix domain-containing protein [Pectobacterium aroidearum]
MWFDGGSYEAVYDRLLVAYNVENQKELAGAMGINPSNISAWVKRKNIPGNAIVTCALDTGADVRWLAFGESENLSSKGGSNKLQGLVGKSLYDMVLSAGGKPILRRMLDAYGFEMQKELGDRFNLSSGTISSWVRRDFFPGDIVVTCALETGVSLRWLVTGQGDMKGEAAFSLLANENVTDIPKYQLLSGELKSVGSWACDKALIPVSVSSPAFVDGTKNSWVIDRDAKTLSNGRWFVDLDGAIDVCDIARLPGNKIKVSSSSAQFDCDVSDVKPVGLVFLTLEKHI